MCIFAYSNPTTIMNKTEKQIAQAAERFAKRWKDKGYEKGESQLFWTELLTEVYGVESPSTVISFEDQVHLDMNRHRRCQVR